MKALEATPRKINEIFLKNYRIPDFQRPYSWNREECEQLWNDIVDFNTHREETDTYFMGTIVVYKEENNDSTYYVIDGQQRMTTIMLLIKAFYDKNTTMNALKSCLFQRDVLTEQYTPNLKLTSDVLEDDRTSLLKIIANEGTNPPKERFQNNMNFFRESIDSWWNHLGNRLEEMNKMINTLLNHIVILPIGCHDQEDALTLFDTINNRGLPLSDADIFKAKLHAAAGDSKKEFVDKWNHLKNHDWLFRAYLHILRAQAGDVSKERAMRTYFLEPQRNRLTDWSSVMHTLKVCYDIEENNELSPSILIYWEILNTYPNYYWKFPLYVFLNKHHTYDQNNNLLFLQDSKAKEFLVLIEELTRYALVKGVVYNSVNVIKDDIFYLCKNIEEFGDYKSFLRSKYIDNLDSFKDKIRRSEFGRYLRAFVILSSALNPNQDKSSFYNLLLSKFHIEHILPRSWNHYDRWTEETHKEKLNTLGNLVIFEQKLNIAAQDSFFTRKKDKYRLSQVQDLLDIDQNESNWYPGQVDQRKELNESRIFSFIEDKA